MLVALNKPFGVLCQFSGGEGRPTLRDCLDEALGKAWVESASGLIPASAAWRDIYPAGRLDLDSEGLLLLSDDGALIHQISDPRHKWPKTYWAQVEQEASPEQISALRTGVTLNDGPTLPANARRLPDDIEQSLWPRDPPIRSRQNIPTSWVELELREGRNRQVRRMTAAVGLPTLRLVRAAIGPYRLDGLAPGHLRVLDARAAPPSPKSRPDHWPRGTGAIERPARPRLVAWPCCLATPDRRSALESIGALRGHAVAWRGITLADDLGRLGHRVVCPHSAGAGGHDAGDHAGFDVRVGAQ
ncbi:MAG: pseudouridine synthase [Ahniella sp.]|nr:pseudouridine synthase [Ahniella sp.]